MNALKQHYWTRGIAFFLIAAIMATNWDIWWHGAVGRDTFFEPPHLVSYSAVFIAIILGVYGYWKTREKIWRNLAMVLVLIPLSGPFDEWWHRLFGVEPVGSILITWSLPHLVIAGTFLASFFLLFPLIKRETDETARRLFGGLSLAAIFTILVFVASPLQPTGPWEIIGFWGAGIVAFFYTLILLKAQRGMPGIGRATLVAIFIILIAAITFGEVINPDLDVIPHDHSPAFLIIFSYLISAIVMDLLYYKTPAWVRGGLGGLIWAGLLYGFSSPFFKPEFQYSLFQAGQAMIASLGGGVLAGGLMTSLKKE